MKQGIIDHWKNLTECNNLLFFAELINELLFDYSIPSNRVSTLNCHYLCIDALSAIEGIENNGVPSGTLKPIMEELYYELGKDPSILANHNPQDYFLKLQDGKPMVIHQISEMNYPDQKRTAYVLNTVFFSENTYYEGLKNQIIEIIYSNSVISQQDMFRMTKAILTELKNGGYDLRYIYRIMNQVFWNPNKPVDSANTIHQFFEAFDFEDHEYDVAFKVKKKKTGSLSRFLDGVELLDNIKNKCVDKEDTSFKKKNQDEVFITIHLSAKDPFSARETACDVIEHCMAVYRLFDHYYQYRIRSAPWGVYDSENRFYQTSTNNNATKHTRTPSKKQIKESITIANKAISEVANERDVLDLVSLMNAIRFHSHSLESFSEENQLLDFWAIFESVLDIRNGHVSDRIIQVCMMLVPILKRRYLYSLFEQLVDDIKEYDKEMIKRIVGDIGEQKEIVKRMCEFVLLPEKESEREKELLNISHYPLLKERIQYYREKLDTTKKVYVFVEKHATRVRWQVMRIYRNRNLIVHNGNKMPYLGLLIENLHSYVDDFLTYTIHSISKGNNIESMCHELFISECKWVEHFSKKKDEVISEEIIQEMLCF